MTWYKGVDETIVVLTVLLPLPAGEKKLIKSNIYMYTYLPIYAAGKKKKKMINWMKLKLKFMRKSAGKIRTSGRGE